MNYPSVESAAIESVALNSRYFQTSYRMLQAIARSGSYEFLGAYLVLARHADGRKLGTFERYTLSGAGVNAIHEKLGVSEETAKGLVDWLTSNTAILAASAEAKAVKALARWEIKRGSLDLDLPHMLVDRPTAANYQSPLRRLRSCPASRPRFSEFLRGVDESTLRLDALMTLLAVYRHTAMMAFGGASPNMLFRKWDVTGVSVHERGLRWDAKPRGMFFNPAFRRECLIADVREEANSENTKLQIARFLNAWETLLELGLLYEAVSLFSAPTGPHVGVQLKVTLRVNDFHATREGVVGDASILGSLQRIKDCPTLGFYTPAENSWKKPEAMWVVLPFEAGEIAGIWRPRFRCSNPDVGAWHASEVSATRHVLNEILPADPGPLVSMTTT